MEELSGSVAAARRSLKNQERRIDTIETVRRTKDARGSSFRDRNSAMGSRLILKFAFFVAWYFNILPLYCCQKQSLIWLIKLVLWASWISCTASHLSHCDGWSYCVRASELLKDCLNNRVSFLFIDSPVAAGSSINFKHPQDSYPRLNNCLCQDTY